MSNLVALKQTVLADVSGPQKLGTLGLVGLGTWLWKP